MKINKENKGQNHFFKIKIDTLNVRNYIINQ